MSQAALKRFTSMAETAQLQIDKFKEELDTDPWQALKWSTKLFEAVATLSVAKMIVYSFTERAGETVATIEEVRQLLMSRVLHRSKYPPQSTSPTSNLVEQYELAAYAEALEELGYLD